MKTILILLFSAANLSAAVPYWQNVTSTGTGTSTTYLSGAMKVYPSTAMAAALPSITLDGITPQIVVKSGVNVASVTPAGFYGNGATLSNIPSTTQVNAIAVSTGAIFTAFSDIQDPTGFFETTSSSLSLSGRVFTISGTNFPVYINGVKFLKSTATVTVPDLTQTNWIYYDLSGNLTQATSFPGFYYPLVATVYYSTDSVVSLLSDERHTAVMDWKTHAYLHQTVGARYASGLAGTFDVNYATITSGVYFDEDLQQDIPQTTRFTVLYKNGPSYFQILASTSAYYKQSAGVLQYNNGNALTNLANGEYVAAWLFASSDVRDKIWVVTGQRVDSSLANARLNNTYETLSLTGFPSSEVKLLYRVILHRAVGSGVSTYDEVADYRTVSTLPGSNYTPTSHSSLSGLSLTAAGHPYNSAGGFASFDASVQKSGDTMTGPLQVTTLTVTGSAFSVGGSTFAIIGGSVYLPAATMPANNGVPVAGALRIATGPGIQRPWAWASDVGGTYIRATDDHALDGIHFEKVNGTAEIMTLLNTGLVGIGNTNPATKLHLSSGTVTLDGNVATALTTVGNVGIGTTAPTAKLVVNGNIVSSGTISAQGDIYAAAYHGDGSALTGLPGGGDAVRASTQTFTGQNTFTNSVTISSFTAFNVTLPVFNASTKTTIGDTTWSTAGSADNGACNITGSTITLTTAGVPVEIVFSGGVLDSANAAIYKMRVIVDGRYLDVNRHFQFVHNAGDGGGGQRSIHFSYLTNALSAGSHSFCLGHYGITVDSTLKCDTGNAATCQFYVREVR